MGLAPVRGLAVAMVFAAGWCPAFPAPAWARNGCVNASRAAELLSSRGPVWDRSGCVTDTISRADWSGLEVARSRHRTADSDECQPGIETHLMIGCC